jgi:hypothetical protein
MLSLIVGDVPRVDPYLDGVGKQFRMTINLQSGQGWVAIAGIFRGLPHVVSVMCANASVSSPEPLSTRKLGSN